MKRSIQMVLGVLGICLSQGSAPAQYFYNPYAAVQMQQSWNPQQMWAGQQMMAAQQMQAMQAAQQQAFLAQPGGANPYSPFSGAMANPYNPAGAGAGVSPLNPLNPYNPYLFGGFGMSGGRGIGEGVALAGSAEVMRAYGTVITSQEQARIMREQANQAKIKTKKDSFDLAMYIKANTPTYTQEEQRIYKSTLTRIQSLSIPGEISSGKSLNYLLDDLRKFPGKKVGGEQQTLSEGVLTHLNVTKNTYGVGLLRDGGRLSWPSALKDPITTPNRRQELDKQIKSMVEDAYRGRLDANVLKDVRNEIDKIRDALVSKVNEIPTGQYIDAKRFLQEFDDATIALQRGEAKVQGDFQQDFVEKVRGGRSIQDLVKYMTDTGLRFGPATADDEAAYRAVYNMLASYDIAMNRDGASDGKE